MQSWCKNLFAAGLSAALLAGCAAKVEEEPVTPLADIHAKVSPKVTQLGDVGAGVWEYYSRLRPAVQYGKIFAADRNGEVVAFDEVTGERVWQQNVNQLFAGALAQNPVLLAAGVTAARNKVFIGGESGLLGALNAENGQVLWHAFAGGELLSAPTVGEDVVVVSTSTGTLEAFNIDTGARLWVYETTLPNLTLRGTGAAAYEAGGFFVGTADGKVAVVIKTNGQAAWEQAISSPTGANEFARIADVDMTPLILGDNLYAASYNGNLVAMELRTGRIIWQRKYSSFNELAAAGLSVFVVDDHSRIYAVDKRNGLELWSNTELTNRALTSPEVYQDYLVVGDLDGYLHFVDRSSGTIVGRIQVDSAGLYGQPLVVGDKIYLQGRSGKLVCVTLS